MRKLIALYFYLEARYEESWKYQCQRFSNNGEPEFSDVEVLSVFYYALMEERRFRLKDIYEFSHKYLLSWFPKLPSYQAFVHRLNALGEVMKCGLSELLVYPMACGLSEEQSVVDSLPVITCSAKRKGRVAVELTDKGYCSTKGMYYYGVKLHALAWIRPGGLPWPEGLVITPASENDLNVFRQYWNEVEQRTIYGDKIYRDEDWFRAFTKQKGSKMLTPVKAIKGMSQATKQFNKAADDLFSTAVSRIRQPIESLFNWIIEKTDIQRASKVRSTKGLLVHIFGKLTAAFLGLLFS